MAQHLVTGDEIKQIADGCKVMTYPELNRYNDINEVFGTGNKIALLYVNQQSPSGTVGHWTTLIKRGGEIEASDPYNFEPDEQFEHIKGNVDGQKRGQLSKMLLRYHNKGGRVLYNEDRVQKMSPDVSTCGRHAGMRLYFHKVPLTEYQNQLDRIKKAGKSTDEFAIWWSKKRIGR